jgi:hypothetical protein
VLADQGLVELVPPNLLRKALAELLNPFQTFFEVRHAGGIAETDVIVRAKRDAGHGGNFLRFEQPVMAASAPFWANEVGLLVL